MKNIAIVGSKPDTWEGCKKLDRRSWQIWRYSRRNFELPPKADKWFELHKPENYERYEQAKPGYTEFLKTAVKHGDFPFDKLLEEFGPYFFSYGQAPWIIAYAISLKPKEIRLFGIEPGKEYGPQKTEVQHFMWIAEDRGIKITAPEDPALSRYRPLYAVDRDHGGALEERGLTPAINFTGTPPRTKKEAAQLEKYGRLIS